MFFIVIGVGIILLHFLGFGPMANWTWNLSGDLWKFAVPFALAAVWWAWADGTGLTKRREMEKMDERKRERRNTGDDDWEWEEYTQYSVIVRSDEGKTKTTTARNSSDVFNYYNIGDRVRHHKGLALFEKYDKSRDAQVMCVACGNFVSFAEDKCPRCRVPLLK